MPAKGNTNESQELDQTVTGEVSTLSPVQRTLRQMAMDAQLDAESGFTGDDLVAIISAESEDELWDSDERPPLNAQHLAGCELEILDVSVKYSRAGTGEAIRTPFVWDGKKMYLMVTAVRVSESGDKAKLIRLPKVGEVFSFNTSAKYVTTKLYQFYVRGFINPDASLKLRCSIRETKLNDEEAVLKLVRPASERAATTA